MKVSRNNYEVWMIDYFDGKLNAGEIAEFMAFINRNPDLREEFEMFDPVALQAENISFDQKKTLKKKPFISVGEVSESNYEGLFVAYYENDLNASQKEDVSKFVRLNPQLEKEFSLHAKLLLMPDESISYSEKKELKKRPVISVYWWAGSVAASLVILFGIFVLLQQNTPAVERELFSLNKVEPRTAIITISNNSNTNLAGREISFIAIPEFTEEELYRDAVELASLPSNSFQPDLIDINDHGKIAAFKYHEPDVIYASASVKGETEKRKGLLARIVTNYANRVSVRQAEKQTKRTDSKKDPGFVKLLDGSITVFNTITGSNTEMVKTYDENGNLKHYQVEGESITWSKSIASNPNME